MKGTHFVFLKAEVNFVNNLFYNYMHIETLIVYLHNYSLWLIWKGVLPKKTARTERIFVKYFNHI